MAPARRIQPIIIFSLVGVVILGVVVVSAAAVSDRLTTPLGPGLDLPTTTADASVAPATPLPASPSEATNTSASATPLPEPLCGGPPTMIVLGVGADNRENNYLYGLADAIRVARVDFRKPSLSVLTFPRDLWVEIPDISDHYGIDHGKLNQSYLYGNPGMGYYDGPGAGPGLLARTLELNYGLRPDHYGAVNMQTFVRLVDAVGGIDIYLEQAVDGRPVDEKTEDMGYFRAGQHHMNGETALRFSRIRKVDNGFRRDDRQTQVLCALKDKVLSPEGLAHLPEIIGAFEGSVLTDLSPAQLAQLACLGPMIDPEDLRFASLPDELMQPARNDQGSFILQGDTDRLRELVQSFVSGDWPTEPDQPSCP
jgi:LCP family protein required for cell wall assembly